MFSKELSASLLRICESRKLSYETASELCDITSRQFGNIVREKSVPSMTTFEKFCSGLGQTPNDLLGYPSEQTPMPIRKAFYKCLPEHLLIEPVCPKCEQSLERINQRYCSHCGQLISWDLFDEAQFIRRF